jgi:putative endonuclease
MSKTQKQIIGAWGEDQAVLFLERLDYRVVERNFLTKRGEIDIVAWHSKPKHGQTLCFIEVKTRSGGDDSHERATDWQKQRSLMFAARAYCLTQKIDIDRTPIQFEQVSVVYRGEADPPEFRHYEIVVE